MENKNTLPTNTEVAIIQTLEMLQNKCSSKFGEAFSIGDIATIQQFLYHIANAKKLDILGQINNLK